MNEYDLDALYLYNNSYRYYIGKIEKVNEKSIRMEWNVKINKDDFNRLAYKLSEVEVKLYRKELIKRLAEIQKTIDSLTRSINALEKSLTYSDFVDLNKDKLQKELDRVADLIAEKSEQCIQLNNEKYKLHGYIDKELKKVEE